MQRLPSHKSYEVKFREAIVKTDLHGILLDAERKESWHGGHIYRHNKV